MRLPRTGVKIALAAAPFSWLRGGPARAMGHSGELTLGTWLLQQPTHREIMAHRTPQGRIRSSATSEGPGVLPDLTSHHALSTSRAPSPCPLLPLSPVYPLSYLLTKPGEPDDGHSIRHK